MTVVSREATVFLSALIDWVSLHRFIVNMNEVIVSFPDASIDYRQHPECYRIGHGERGVFHVQPYKDELLPLWAIRNEADAKQAITDIHDRYLDYRRQDDFAGMDMARKYLQMGYTRARRYARYPGGRKKDADGRARQPRNADAEKAHIAELYRESLDRVRDDEVYQNAKREYQRRLRSAKR
ncbi:DUF4385 family protein [Salinicola halimionae]|uniref:DUF4385 family protein n=1 Tax=Salinicola halimionae TaxID=1949081 RepID=UPI001FD89815|nr:DUF4385 family protein [Salinicola halimionae]